MTFSKSKLLAGDALELLRFNFALNCERLKSEFDKVDVEIIEDKDLIMLSELSKNKLDISGAVKDDNNNPVMFDVVKILTNFTYSDEEKSLAKTFNYTP